MAPYDEDFVLTISDHGDLPSSGELDSEAELPKPTTRKRKRGLKDAGKEQIKRVKSAPLGPPGELESSEEEEEDAGIQDDVIDPGFTFDVGDSVVNGTIEDFDGWGTSEHDGKKNGVTAGLKAAVNIDSIIARRAAGRRAAADKGSSSFSEAGNGIDLESEEALGDGGSVDNTEDQDDDDEGPMFEDDELLAQDGFGAGADSEDEGGASDPGMDENALQPSDNSVSEPIPESGDESVASPMAHPEDLASDDDSASTVPSENPDEIERRAAFFAPEEKSRASQSSAKASDSNSFQSFSLSRPLLRGIAAVNFTQPTPIQKRTIPIALAGKDVVGSAVTGSGKTAAFLLPILERLLYRPRKVPTTRVAILLPTRELAIQCYNVAVQLAQFTDITFAQVVGGFSLREQESLLKRRPDVVIATPGRFIDHMRNSASFAVENIEILVLDEADRMLEDGFADELDEILKTIPKGRQTMLFSATMTDSVDKLVRVGMNRPVRVSVDAKRATVEGLVQEFVRLRPGREEKRMASLLLLCTEVHTTRAIVFFRQKKEVHRARIIFGLLGIQAGELHGGMSQEQRVTAVESFRAGRTTHLLATDLASRGLDIKNVLTVINYEAPQTHEIYLHRIGRTARAGKSGRACTIAAEPDRKVVKAAVKSARAQSAKILSRALDSSTVDAMDERVQALEQDIEEILQEEKEEKQLAQADLQLTRGENLVKHESEIMSRPKRTWFETEKEKRAAKKAGLAELNGPPLVKSSKGKRKLSGKDKKRLDDRRERAEGKVWRKGKRSEESANVERKQLKAKAKTKSAKTGSKKRTQKPRKR